MPRKDKKRKRCKDYIKGIGCVGGQGYPLDNECRGYKKLKCNEPMKNKPMARGKKIFNKLLELANTSMCKKMKFAACVYGDDFLSFGINAPIQDRCCIRGNIKSGTCLERCYAIHAEQSAILNALLGGAKLPNCELYVLGVKDGKVFNNNNFYCTICARIIFVSKIGAINVWRNNNWITLSPEQILNESYDNQTSIT